MHAATLRIDNATTATLDRNLPIFDSEMSPFILPSHNSLVLHFRSRKSLNLLSSSLSWSFTLVSLPAILVGLSQ